MAQSDPKHGNTFSIDTNKRSWCREGDFVFTKHRGRLGSCVATVGCIGRALLSAAGTTLPTYYALHEGSVWNCSASYAQGQ